MVATSSFITPANGEEALGEHVAQLTENFSGLRNIPISLTGINDAAAYALTIKNAGTGSKGELIYAADGTTVLFQVDSAGVKVSRAGGAAEAVITSTSSLFTAWTTFTPTLNQSAAITVTVDYAAYMLIGKTALVQIRYSCSSAGTAANPIEVGSIPAAIAPKRTSGSVATPAGIFHFVDATGPTHYAGSADFINGSQLRLYSDAATGAFGVNAAVTIASGDLLGLNLSYETA